MALGVTIEIDANTLIIGGCGGKVQFIPNRKEIYMGDSGTSFRLLLSVVSLGRGECLLTGTPRMLKRPIGALVNALNQLGVQASCDERDGYPTVHIKARSLRGGKSTLDGGKSGQVVSSVLLSGPIAEKEVEVDMNSMLDMVPTLAAIALFAKGKTIIRNVPHLRYKESDRLGARIEERVVGLRVLGIWLKNELCENKSFRNFWELWDKL